jgi:putative membrane protein
MNEPFQSKKDVLLLLGKGMAMGAADIVPGVSGGTIAFITGIYERLLAALTAFRPKTMCVIRQQGLVAFWQAVDGWFLLILFTGIMTSILSFANIISYLTNTFPISVWSFFFGLVVASIICLIKQVSHWRRQECLAILIGTIVAVLISVLRPVQLPDTWWMMVLSGFIAICAMILPGVSGSFILLMMGMYGVFIQAITNMNILFLASFGLGCVAGLLVFSHFLSFLLRQYHSMMMAVLTGFLIGSLNVIWPWKAVVQTTINRHGEVIPLVQENILPWSSGNDRLWLPILIALLGFLIVFILDRMTSKNVS